ncbi:MAG TPA: DUF4214 domain-containing protein [Gemmataceae bacterium]|nr:DUF4214 domain-containing protein [Gemmataceae bacterium]
MKRTMTFALSGLLAFAGFTQAQYSPPSSGQGSGQRLINSRYESQGSLSRSPSSPNGHLAQESFSGSTNDPAFAPLAYIGRLYVDVLGREPSEAESRYWLQRLDNQTRAEIALELQQRRPVRWIGNYDPRYGGAYDPGYGSRYYPDPASLNFRDPGGSYFKSPYFPNYQYRRNMRAFPLGARG